MNGPKCNFLFFICPTEHQPIVDLLRGGRVPLSRRDPGVHNSGQQLPVYRDGPVHALLLPLPVLLDDDTGTFLLDDDTGTFLLGLGLSCKNKASE